MKGLQGEDSAKKEKRMGNHVSLSIMKTFSQMMMSDFEGLSSHKSLLLFLDWCV